LTDCVTPSVTLSVEASPRTVPPTERIPPRYVPPIVNASPAPSDRENVGNPGSLLGTTVGDFAIEAVIGGGSFGTVYRGRQRGLDRAVAIKVPTYEIASDPVQAERFAREARAAARIVHPGVVAIYAVGELTDGRPYLAMQLIDGVPLTQVLADGPLPAARALGIARDIASALADTHAAGVVHRDLKPSNIMWRRDRLGDDRITIVDFGIAVCRPGHADASRLTSNGLIGTPHYMSPEQTHGDPVDARADLYALGCLLFELVTGAPPFVGAGVDVLLAHLGKPAPSASERIPEVPAVVDRLIAQLLRKAPDDRPANADATVGLIDDAIAAITDAPAGRALARASARSSVWLADESASPSLPRSLVRQRTPRRWLAGAIGALAIGAAGLIAYARFADPGSDDTEALEGAHGTPVSSTGEPLRLIARDDGELIVKTLVPEAIHAGVPVRAHIEIRTKLGSAFSAKQVVITIEDPHHNAVASTASMHSSRPGHYAFRHTFSEPGTYVVRIFPSETETVSTVELDVVP
jgi:serine/threonine protein kinase